LQLGAIGYLGLLSVQYTYQIALIALVQAQAARYADTPHSSRPWVAAGGTARMSHRRRRGTSSSCL